MSSREPRAQARTVGTGAHAAPQPRSAARNASRSRGRPAGMRTLRFDAPASHVLLEGGERVRGGETFVTGHQRALQLFADPHVPVSEI